MALNPESRMTQEAAFEAAIIALKAQGLAPTEFGLAMRDRVLRGEITSSEAIRLIQEYYKARNHTPAAAAN